MITLLTVFGWFVVILTLSIIMMLIHSQVSTSSLKFVLDIIFFIGVVVHELAHACFLLCTGIIPTGFRVRYRSRDTGLVSPNGKVSHKKSDGLKMTFMQGFFTALAPLFVSTFTFLFMLDLIFNTTSPDLIKLVAVIILVSVLLGSAPSNADLNSMARSFKNRPKYSLYQLLLAGISVLIVIFYFDLTFLVLPFEVVYYILYCFTAIGIFFSLKYTILTLKVLIVWIIHRFQKYNAARKTPRIPPMNVIRELSPYESMHDQLQEGDR